jgi:hypothetical protein
MINCCHELTVGIQFIPRCPSREQKNAAIKSLLLLGLLYVF